MNVVKGDKVKRSSVGSISSVSSNQEYYCCGSDRTCAGKIWYIQNGVIDGGDEVEDKTTKRRSVSRVRYVLMVSA
jgi:hypothetical protein